MWQLDADNAENTTFEDKADNGTTEMLITHDQSANGAVETYRFDLDGDGTIDLTRHTVISYDEEGNRVTRFTETYGDEKVEFTRQTKDSANGLSSLSTVDLDGDGITDGTTRTKNDAEYRRQFEHLNRKRVHGRLLPLELYRNGQRRWQDRSANQRL